MNNFENKTCGKLGWLHHYVLKGIQYIVISIFIIVSGYGIWGWITLNDIRQYCTDKNLDFEKVIIDCIPEMPSFSYEDDRKGAYTFSIPSQSIEKKYPELERYFVPFLSVKLNDKGLQNISVVSILGPFLFLTENTSNAIFCLALGYVMSLSLVAIKFIRDGQITFKFIFLRPLVGSLSSLVLYLIILSGGKLIWVEAAGVSSLSLGVISAVASIYCEKIKFLSNVLL